MAPSVPGGTRRRVVSIKGVPPKAWPISEETVSAAASARADATQTDTTTVPMLAFAPGQTKATAMGIKGNAHKAARPKLATTWEVVRPDRLSARPLAAF